MLGHKVRENRLPTTFLDFLARCPAPELPLGPSPPLPSLTFLYQGSISILCRIKTEFRPGLKWLPVVMRGGGACLNDKWWQFVQTWSLRSLRTGLNGRVLPVSATSVTRPHAEEIGFFTHSLTQKCKLTRDGHNWLFYLPIRRLGRKST